MADRKCETCGGSMPARTHRQTDEHGRLVCEECITMKTPSWNTAYSALTPIQKSEFKRREAEALTSIFRISRKVAHDGGDMAVVHHCPMCGSGAVTGGNDGTIECDFCHTHFTVQIQPAHPNMPQTIDGQPVTPPGMPGGEHTELSAPSDPAVAEDEDGVAAEPLVDPEADPAAKPNPFEKKDPAAKDGDDKDKPKGNQPPWLKNKKSSAKYFTDAGDVLDEDKYLAHLALALADDKSKVLAEVRAHNGRA